MVIPSLPDSDELNEKCVVAIEETKGNGVEVEVVLEVADAPFAVNVNNGVRKATHEIVMILNNDAMVLPGWDKWGLEVLGQKDAIVALTPRADCGWGFGVTKKLWNDVGELDEQLVNSYEDYDFFIRAALKGYYRYRPTRMLAIHAGGLTLDRVWGHVGLQAGERLRQCKVNRLYMEHKWPGVAIDSVPSLYFGIHGVRIMKEWRNAQPHCA